jgi:dolichyl-phosphate beta-glucosyltransferase
MTPPLLSIVFPAYNEAQAIRRALEQALAFADDRGLDVEIVVVDDGSRDDTLAIAQDVASEDARVSAISHSPNRGKGFAVRQGMRAARGRWRVFLDVDLATPMEEIDRLLPELEAGADVVLGSRHLPDSTIDVRQGRLRESMGSIYRRLARWLLRLPVSDVTCGFKGFRGEAAERLFAALTEDGWAFDAELIHLAAKWDMRLVELAVCWRDSRNSTVRPLAAARESLAALLRIRRNERRGVYERPSANGR